MDEKALRELLCKVGKSFFARGLSGGASGNMSLRLPNGNFLATPTGLSLGDLKPEKLSLLDKDGQHLDGLKPTKEVFVHLACYKAREDAGHKAAALVHLHSPWAVAWACLQGHNDDDCVPSLTPYGLMRYGRVGFSPYRKPGSAALAEDMARIMPRHKAVLLANHGAIVMGDTLAQAADNMEELEASCRLALTLLPATQGRVPRLLNAEEQAQLLGSGQ